MRKELNLILSMFKFCLHFVTAFTNFIKLVKVRLGCLKTSRNNQLGLIQGMKYTKKSPRKSKKQCVPNTNLNEDKWCEKNIKIYIIYNFHLCICFPQWIAFSKLLSWLIGWSKLRHNSGKGIDIARLKREMSKFSKLRTTVVKRGTRSSMTAVSCLPSVSTIWTNLTRKMDLVLVLC